MTNRNVVGVSPTFSCVHHPSTQAPAMSIIICLGLEAIAQLTAYHSDWSAEVVEMNHPSTGTSSHTSSGCDWSCNIPRSEVILRNNTSSTKQQSNVMVASIRHHSERFAYGVVMAGCVDVFADNDMGYEQGGGFVVICPAISWISWISWSLRILNRGCCQVVECQKPWYGFGWYEIHPNVWDISFRQG